MTDREAAAGLVELRRKLAGVGCPAFGGDNLAIFLASEFEPGVEDDEMDESETWKQGAIDLSNQVMDAIHAHYAAAFTTLLSELERVERENAALRGLDDGRWKAAEARALKAEKERDSWKNVCRSAGVCMSCALGAPDHFGCTDCLNTGWDGGSPAGFVLEAVATKAESLVAEAAQLLQRQANIADWYSDREDDNFEIWRDWYQASGDFRITVGECRAARAFVEKHKESGNGR